MKSTKLFLALAFALPLVFTACSDDDENDDDDNNQSLEFQDRDLQGTIAGSAWTYMSGNATESFSDSTKVMVNLFSVVDTNSCDFVDPQTDQVIFTVPMAEGTYTLTFDGATTQTVTLLEVATFNNVIATNGKIQITSVDTATNQLSGRVVAEADSDNSVNGNFTVTICD